MPWHSPHPSLRSRQRPAGACGAAAGCSQLPAPAHLCCPGRHAPRLAAAPAQHPHRLACRKLHPTLARRQPGVRPADRPVSHTLSAAAAQEGPPPRLQEERLAALCALPQRAQHVHLRHLAWGAGRGWVGAGRRLSRGGGSPSQGASHWCGGAAGCSRAAALKSTASALQPAAAWLEAGGEVRWARANDPKLARALGNSQQAPAHSPVGVGRLWRSPVPGQLTQQNPTLTRTGLALWVL